MLALGFIVGVSVTHKIGHDRAYWIAFGAALAEIVTSPVTAAFWRGLTGGAQ
jgi:hypothetical protein